MDTLKLCTRCKQEKPISEFYPRSDCNGHRPHCKGCCKEASRGSVNNSVNKAANQARWKKKDRLEHPEKYKRLAKESYARDRINNPEALLLRAAKHRAKEKNKEFTIDLFDIVIPERCPVLGIELMPATGKGPRGNSPSLDRIDSRLGYIKGNVRVISHRANALRNNGTAEEMELVLKDMKKCLALG